MNFAPYQSSPPESTRALSPPPPRSSTASPTIRNPLSTPTLPPPYTQQRAKASVDDPWAAARGSALPSPSAFVERGYDDLEANQGGSAAGGLLGGAGGMTATTRSWGGDGAYVFETSLGIRMGVEAALAYLLVPPIGGFALLMFERKSDYVRFHAWQSSLVFAAVFIVHLIFSWSSSLSWLFFIADLALIAWLALRAYKDAETLDRLELPFFGRLASQFVDQE